MVVRRKRKNGGAGAPPAKRRRFGPVKDIRKMRQMARKGGMGPRGKRGKGRKGSKTRSGAREMAVSRIRSRRVRPRIRQNATRLLAKQMPYRILKIQAINPLDRAVGGTVANDTPGFFCNSVIAVNNIADLSTSPVVALNLAPWAATLSYIGTPIYLFDLTLTNNTAVAATNVCYRLYYGVVGTALTGPFWAQVKVPTDAGAVTSNSWVVEKTNQTQRDAGLNTQYVRTEWYDIRLELLNAKTQASYHDVGIISFTNECLCPDGDRSKFDDEQTHNSFWNAMAQRYVGATTLGSTMSVPKGKHKFSMFKRIYHSNQQTGDEDRSANVVTHRVFARDGRIRNYRWSDSKFDSSLQLAEVFDPRSFARDPQWSSGVDVRNVPQGRARKYLFVSAFDQTRTAATGFGEDNAQTSNTAPSFNALIRKKETYLAQLIQN